MKISTSLLTTLALYILSSLPALAGNCPGGTCPGGTPLPEPGSLALLAVGAAVGAVVWVRNRNK